LPPYTLSRDTTYNIDEVFFIINGELCSAITPSS
jgi:hypothetical protein